LKYLKFVQIDDTDGQARPMRRVYAVQALALLVQAPVEGLPVVQAGEQVGVGHDLQLLVGF
jgi:hypothetical protein